MLTTKSDLEEAKNSRRIHAPQPTPSWKSQNGHTMSSLSKTYVERSETTTPVGNGSSYTNGSISHPERPSSVASRTPPATTPVQSVWASIHAPRTSYPREQQYASNGRAPTKTTARAQFQSPYRHITTAASPTPSVVSVTPTQGEDGWWS